MTQQKNSDPFGSIPIASSPEPSDADNGADLSQPESSSSQTTPTPHRPSPDSDIKIAEISGETGGDSSKSQFSRKLVRPKSKGPFFLRAAKVLASGFLILAGLYLLGGYFLFPYLIRTYGAQKLTKLSSRPVTISHASFNPLSLRLELGNSIVGPVSTDPEDTIDPVISFAHLIVDLDPRSLIYRGVVCNELTINQLFVHVTNSADGSTNISKLWHRLVSGNAKQEGNLPATFFASVADYLKNHYSLNNITVTNSEIIFADSTTNKKHHINDLHIAVPSLATLDYQKPLIKPQFSAVINGKSLSTTDSQNQDLDASRIQFSLNMDAIDIVPYKNYLPAGLDRLVHSGQADITLQITYNPLTAVADDQLRFSGELTLHTIVLEESAKTITMETTVLEGWFAPLSNNFHLNKLVFTGPDFFLTKSTKGSLELSAPFNLLQSTVFSAQGNNQRVDRFEIIGGRMQFIDGASSKGSQNWREITLSVSSNNITSAADNTEKQVLDFSLSGKNSLQTKINMQGLITSKPFSVKGFFEASELDLGALTDLSGWFSGTLITKGTAKRLKSNFSYEQKPDAQDLLLLDNLHIRARDMLLAKNNTPLALIDDWQSENGFFYTTNPVLQFGSVQIKNAKFYAYPAGAKTPWQSLIAPGSTRPKGAIINQTKISSLEISDSTIIFTNTIADTPIHTLSHFRLSAPQIKQEGQSLFSASVASGSSPITASGAFSLNPFLADGHIKAEALPAAFVNRIFVPDPHYDTKGTLRLEGSFQLPALSYDGAASLSDLSLSGNNYSFESPHLNSTAISIKTKPLALSLGSLSIERPHLNCTITEKSPSLLSTFTAEPVPQSQNKPTVSLDALYVSDGQLSLSNKTAGSELDTVVEMVQGSFSKSAGEDDGSFSFRGKLDAVAPFVLDGTTTLFGSPKAIQAKYQISNYPAPKRSSFLAYFLGYTIIKGQLNLTGTLQASRNTISHALDIGISALELGPAIEKNLIKMKGNLWESAPLLQALLQNKDGMIDLPLSYSSTAAGPDFDSGEAIINQYEKQLLKARVSPFSFFDLKIKDALPPQTIFFEAGSSTLSAANRELLHNLASQLIDHPLLKITITGHADSNADRKILYDEKLADILKRQRQHDAKLSEALSDSYGQEIIDQPFSVEDKTGKAYDVRKWKFSIQDETLLKLARKRIEGVLEFIKNEGVAKCRIIAGQTTIIDPQPLGRDGNRIDFSLGI